VSLVSVARRYKFEATHSLPGFEPRWAEPHRHLYTVEVVADSTVEGELHTDRIDEAWTAVAHREDPDLNKTHAITTVEGLAADWLLELRASVPQISAVTVWEDDSRWGRAERGY
jgi:hypothetical protein